MRIRTLAAAGAVVIGLAAPGLGLTSASAATRSMGAGAAVPAEVSFVQGLPGLPVDVYEDGTKILSDFTFKTVTSDYPLDAGTYRFAIRPAGAKSRSKPILSASKVLTAGESATLVIYLSTTGTPELKMFVNPAGAPADGNARIIVRHVADASAVDVFLGTRRSAGERVIKGLTNPHQATLVIPHTTLYVRVFAAGTHVHPVIGPKKFVFRAGTTTIIYAVGSLAAKTLTIVSHSD